MTLSSALAQYNRRLSIAAQQKKSNSATKAKAAAKAKAPQKRKRGSSQAEVPLSPFLVLRPIAEPVVGRREIRSIKEARVM